MKDRILYLECFSGISGDMAVAALLDLGVDIEVLKKALFSLPIDGFQIKIDRRRKCGINGCSFDVILDGYAQEQNCSDDYIESDHHGIRMPGKEESASDMVVHNHEEKHVHGIHEVHNKEEHGHIEEHSHSKEHGHNHNHDHRNLSDIFKILEGGELSENALFLAKKIFMIVAKPEAQAHGLGIEEVHFHEVGALDSIIDIAAAAICMDELQIKDVVISPLYEGTGHVRCQHGIIPIPVPAVVNIASSEKLVMKTTDTYGEMVTPTGAAIAAAIKTRNHLPHAYFIEKIGIGAGKKDFPKANILRAMILVAETNIVFREDEVWMLECNIDDSCGEILGYTMERLFENGALDVYYTPIYMKKNRPAYLLGVICKEEDVEKLELIIFEESSTIGIRKKKMTRNILPRQILSVDTEYGNIDVKKVMVGNKSYCYPEYESVRKAALHNQVGYSVVYGEVIKRSEQYI